MNAHRALVTRGPCAADAGVSSTATDSVVDGPLVTGPLGPLVTQTATSRGRVDLSAAVPELERRFAAGVDGRFRCPIPGHAGFSLIGVPPSVEDPGGAGEPRLLCCTGRWRSLGEVRAAEAYGRDPGALTNIELAIWVRRLAHELGVFEPIGVLVPALEPTASRGATSARAGFQLLAGLRWADYERRPIAFSIRFAAAWCGLSFRDANLAIKELRAGGIIVQADKGGPGNRIPLYLPGQRA